MMLLQKISMLTLVVIFCFACGESGNSTKTENQPAKDSSSEQSQTLVFDKLLGTWKNEDGKSFERWTKNSSGAYNVNAFRLQGRDTIYTEEISVYKENDKWISENKVLGQNEGKAVKFTATLLTENRVQFSNPAHDFPTDISYTVVDANTINAFIVGPNNKGGKDTIPFNFTRVHK